MLVGALDGVLWVSKVLGIALRYFSVLFLRLNNSAGLSAGSSACSNLLFSSSGEFQLSYFSTAECIFFLWLKSFIFFLFILYQSTTDL